MSFGRTLAGLLLQCSCTRSGPARDIVARPRLRWWTCARSGGGRGRGLMTEFTPQPASAISNKAQRDEAFMLSRHCEHCASAK